MINQQPPGPKGDFLVGNLLQLRQQGFLPLMQAALVDYPDIVFVRAGTRRIYLMNHPDYVAEVLVRQADKFYKTKLVKKVFEKTFGNGIGFSDGEFHRRQRQLVQPALHPTRFGKYSEVMVAHTQQIIDEWQTGQTIELKMEMTRLTMEVAAETLFGTEIQGRTADVSAALTAIVDSAKSHFKEALFKLPMWVPTAQRRQEAEAIGKLDTLINEIIGKRRASGVDNGDLLSKLIMATDENSGAHMTDKQARDEAITLFLGGYETTSLALTWTFYLLVAHPEIQAKVVAEIDEVLQGRTPTVEDLPRLEYMEKVVKEAVRLYPSLWVFNREPIEDLVIGGYTIPKGSTVFVCPFLTHRDERWFPDPERFDPERFAAGYQERIPRYAYFPFGAGPRVCPGQLFGVMEMMISLAMILTNFELTLTSEGEITPKASATLRPRQPIFCRLTAREKQPPREVASLV